jgi:hypothetical protein
VIEHRQSRVFQGAQSHKRLTLRISYSTANWNGTMFPAQYQARGQRSERFVTTMNLEHSYKLAPHLLYNCS